MVLVVKSTPGISREQRISTEGLERLEKHLQRGMKISLPVLQQWIRRYGEDARVLLKDYGYEIND